MATLDELWEDLLSAALVGTDRRPYAPAAGGPGHWLANLKTDDPARAWLASAGAVSVLRLAGRRPVHLPVADLVPSAPDVGPRCQPAAAQHLAQMLGGQMVPALPEWLRAAANAGVRVPEEHLPELLDWARTQPELRAAVCAVIGERGRWLARQNERWAYAAAPVSAPRDASLETLLETWELAVFADRLALLAELRASNPPTGRALVQHSWAEDKVDDRLAFVKQLSLGLSLADESFLEQVLRERAWSLRQAASRLLTQLPESQLCRRMRKLARPLLRLEGGPRGTRKRSAAAGPSLRLMVNLPETQVEVVPHADKPPTLPAKETDRARWLSHLLGMVPPMDWCRALKLSPSELVVLARANILDFALVEGWAAAAAAFGDMDWAEALLRERLPELDTAALAPLLRVLSPVRREALVYGAMAEVERLAQRQPGLRLLQAYAEPWSPRLTRLFVRKLSDEIARRDVPFGPTLEFGWLLDAARWWDPSVAPEAAPALLRGCRQPGGWMNWLHTVEQALALWQFRQAMLEELKP